MRYTAVCYHDMFDINQMFHYQMVTILLLSLSYWISKRNAALARCIIRNRTTGTNTHCPVEPLILHISLSEMHTDKYSEQSVVLTHQ